MRQLHSPRRYRVRDAGYSSHFIVDRHGGVITPPSGPAGRSLLSASVAGDSGRGRLAGRAVDRDRAVTPASQVRLAPRARVAEDRTAVGRTGQPPLRELTEGSESFQLRAVVGHRRLGWALGAVCVAPVQVAIVQYLRKVRARTHSTSETANYLRWSNLQY